MAHQNTFNKPDSFVCIFTKMVRIRWPRKIRSFAAEVGHNPLTKLMHVKPNYANNFKNGLNTVFCNSCKQLFFCQVLKGLLQVYLFSEWVIKIFFMLLFRHSPNCTPSAVSVLWCCVPTRQSSRSHQGTDERDAQDSAAAETQRQARPRTRSIPTALIGFIHEQEESTGLCNTWWFLFMKWKCIFHVVLLTVVRCNNNWHIN